MLSTNTALADYAAAEGGVAGAAVASGVSWAAIIAGGVAASAISIILLILGAGFGLASVSPWTGSGLSAAGFTVLAAIWLVLVQWVSSAFGGYMAGRLRTKWTGVHTDEVFFRDTAHGFLAWALATLIAVGVLSAAAGSAASGGMQAVAAAAPGAQGQAYYVDELFRQTVIPAGAPPAANNGAAAMATGLSDRDTRAQAGAILAHEAAAGGISTSDHDYLTQLVSGRTGMAPADAATRVDNVLGQIQSASVKARQVADAARSASSKAAIFTFIALLIGAFIASVSGAIGGRLRDQF